LDRETKSIAIKELSDEGQIEAVISTFGRDRDGDVMTREAFTGSAGKSIPMVWSHDWAKPIGKGVVSVSDGGAIFRGQFFLDTHDGMEAYKTVKAMDDLQEYSIGFQIKDADSGHEIEDGKRVYTRTIKDIELFEASPVLVGAAYNTGTIAVKSPKGQADLHEQLKALHEQHESSCELGDACPLATKSEEPDEDPDTEIEGEEIAPVSLSPERAKAMSELEAFLGYRPLSAGKA